MTSHTPMIPIYYSAARDGLETPVAEKPPYDAQKRLGSICIDLQTPSDAAAVMEVSA